MTEQDITEHSFPDWPSSGLWITGELLRKERGQKWKAMR